MENFNFELGLYSFSTTTLIFCFWHVLLAIFMYGERKFRHRIVVSIMIVMMQIPIIYFSVKLGSSYVLNVIIMILHTYSVFYNFFVLKAFKKRISEKEKGKQ